MFETRITKSFNYEALNSIGEKIINGKLAAVNKEDAIQQIRDMGLFPTRVKEIVTEEKIVYTSKQSYFQYLSELIGTKLIEWGNFLKERQL